MRSVGARDDRTRFLGTYRYAEVIAFNQRALTPLGMSLLRESGAEAAFGTTSHWSFFLYPVAGGEPVVAKGTHVALAAASRALVAQVHEAALGAGALDIFAPRECLYQRDVLRRHVQGP